MPEVGYFDEVVDAGFQSPEPIMVDYLEDLSAGERVLLQQRLIPEDVGLVANEAIAQAERVTGVLLLHSSTSAAFWAIVKISLCSAAVFEMERQKLLQRWFVATQLLCAV